MRFRESIKELEEFSLKEKNKKCQACFIKDLCNGCLGLNSFYTGNPFVLSDEICNMFRQMTEMVIIEMVKWHKNRKE